MASKQKRIRLFLGVKVSMATVSALAEVAELMRRESYDAGYQIRWVAPATYHVTLKFLGWAQPEVVASIRDQLEPHLATVPSFEVTTVGLGAFPDPKNARVIWAGIDDPDGHLQGLAQAIEDHLAALGFAREKRAFHPHVTLGRVKRVDDISPLLRQVPEQNFRSTRVRRVTLFESIMKSSGSEYASRAELELSRPRSDAKRQTEGLKGSTQDGLGEVNHRGQSENGDRPETADPAPPSNTASPPNHAVQPSQEPADE